MDCELPEDGHILLPYFGTSVRVAPSPGCNVSSAMRGKQPAAQGRAQIATCASSRGGAHLSVAAVASDEHAPPPHGAARVRGAALWAAGRGVRARPVRAKQAGLGCLEETGQIL